MGKDSTTTTATVPERAVARATTRLLAPKRVFAGRFELLRRIGAGGMGDVYEAHDLELDERVALKTLSSTISLGGEGLSRMRDEVRLARRITHPNVVRIFDIGEDEGTHYFTMELLTGQSLDHRIGGRPLPVRLARRFAVQIARGLAAAHAAGVIHRDLKPSNVVIAGDRVVVTDFGVARAFRTRLAGESSGTPGYMAPEQREGHTEELRTDLWAFGLVLHEMLSGERIHTPDEVHGDDALESLVRSCLALEPEARPSAAEVLRQLESGPCETTGARPQQAIAVLPPVIVGAPFDPALLRGMGLEMIDALARLRGLEVVSLAAASAFTSDRDPKRIGEALKVDAVVDTTLRRSGDRLRLDARLVDARTGFQVWAERIEDTVDGMLTMQEALAGRIAEHLRVTLDVAANRGWAPAAVLEEYLRARAKLQGFQLIGPDGAIAALERVVDEAPGLRAAVAALATAHTRAWFQNTAPTADLEAAAADAVAESLREAPDLPEAHVAAAALASHRGEYAASLRATRRALELAPLCAPAHEQLCVIEGETGRLDDAIRRARHAISLDPSLMAARFTLLSRLELLGRFEEAQAVLAEAERFDGGVLAVATLRLSIALGERAPLERLAGAGGPGAPPSAQAAAHLARLALGLSGPEAARAEVDAFASNPHHGARRLGYMCQLHAEALSMAGATGAVLEVLERAGPGLLDVPWLERSRALAGVRGDARFQAVLRQVSERAHAVWA